jgi:signal transduction histidine kinase
MRLSELRISKRAVLAFAVLGLFILLDLVLFGWLIFRSLSQREIERVLLDTREQAQGLAEQIADRASEGDPDLYAAVASEQETLSYIGSILQQRDIVQTLEIRDKDDLLVYKSVRQTTVPAEPSAELPVLGDPEVPVSLDTWTVRRDEQTFQLETSPFDIKVPIGDLGFVYVGISPGQMEQRIEVLRGDLMRQVGLIGAITLTLLSVAYLTVWLLYRRGRRLEEQAAEAERMAYIGTLASGLAHEIRNPLNALRLNMQMLEEDLGRRSGRGTESKILSITQSEINRLERLATDFLSYARPRPLELEEVSAVDLLTSVRDVLAADVAAKGVTVSLEDRSGGATLRVDPAQMKQLLLNLVQNAITAAESTARTGEVRLVARRHDRNVLLEVVDNGRGIPAAEQARIFDLFYSTRKGGTGLGLAIVKRIAQAHDADLTVVSQPGAGTTVSVAMPIASDPAKGGAEHRMAEAAT